jgi:coenzyme F420 hydrogenase subunit beta
MGGIKLKTEVLSLGTCALCGACLDWCPYLKNLEDHVVMAFDCNIEDGRCHAVCPRTFTDWEGITAQIMPERAASSEIGYFDAVHKVRSRQSISGQQDGGTVTTLIKTALEHNLAQAALLTGSSDNITPEPLIADAQNINNHAGSRYLAATGLRKLSEVNQRGIESLAVVGRPCQIQALRKMQTNRPQDLPNKGIVTIGLFCMWSLAWNFKDYLEQQWPGRNIKRVAIPRHGLEITTNQGTHTIPTSKVREFIREGCHYCLDMTAELADISVGALESEPGWNTVIIRTVQGRRWFERALADESLMAEPYPAGELQRLKEASRNKKVQGLTNITKHFEQHGVKPFIDPAAGPYREILSEDEGTVNK